MARCKLLRVGIGYDGHPLKRGRKLVLGGVNIPYPEGTAGHSDADVLLHSIVDAILGALGEGDIGEYFPDTDPEYKDISSEEFLKEILALLKKRNGKIINVDTVIILDRPKLLEYKQRIRKNIARILNIDEERVNIKAKTQEGLKREKSILSFAVVSIKI